MIQKFLHFEYSTGEQFFLQFSKTFRLQWLNDCSVCCFNYKIRSFLSRFYLFILSSHSIFSFLNIKFSYSVQYTGKLKYYSKMKQKNIGKQRQTTHKITDENIGKQRQTTHKITNENIGKQRQTTHKITNKNIGKQCQTTQKITDENYDIAITLKLFIIQSLSATLYCIA